jgi:hypothetical protein
VYLSQERPGGQIIRIARVNMSSDSSPPVYIVCPNALQHATNALQGLTNHTGQLQVVLRERDDTIAGLRKQVEDQRVEKEALLADNLRIFEQSVKKAGQFFDLEAETNALRDELAALKAKGRAASTQTSPAKGRESAVQTRPVSSQDFAAQTRPVKGKDCTVQTSTAVSTSGVQTDLVMLARKVPEAEQEELYPLIFRTPAVEASPVKLQVVEVPEAKQGELYPPILQTSKITDEERQQAALQAERDRRGLFVYDLELCQADIVSALAEARIVEALQKQEATMASRAANVGRKLAKQVRIQAAKEAAAAQKLQAEREAQDQAKAAQEQQEELERIKAAQAAEAAKNALAQVGAGMTVQQAARLKAQDKAKKESLTALEKMAQFGQSMNTVFGKVDKHGFEFKSLDGGIPSLLRMYLVECIGANAFQLEQKGSTDKFRLIAKVLVEGNFYEHTSPFVTGANIVFWLDEHVFRDACKAFYGVAVSTRNKAVEATIKDAFEGVKDTMPFMVLQLDPVQRDSRYGLPDQRITSPEGWHATGSMLQMTLWYYIGKIAFLARLDVLDEC